MLRDRLRSARLTLGASMPNQSDREYFAERAKVERRMSTTAPDPNVAIVHEQLANRYDKLAKGLNGARPRLTIAARGSA